jgi:hypothetical protein
MQRAAFFASFLSLETEMKSPPPAGLPKDSLYLLRGETEPVLRGKF